MSRKPYKAKSLSGAQQRVRDLMKQIETYESICWRMRYEAKLLAMLAAKGPAFFSPLDVVDAEQVRDRILRTECRMNPDGTFLPAPKGTP